MMPLGILYLLSTVQRMFVTRKTQLPLKMIFILSILINLSYTQSSTNKYRVSNIEITPTYVVMNSTSITNFLCINYQPNDLPLEANLSRIIPSNQMKLSIISSNMTAINIQLESINYIGIFHLLCYEKGQQAKGTLADVFVKAAPGVIIRQQPCEVFEKLYIKCKIKADNIATAIQNGYIPRFKFEETNHPSDQAAYIQPHEFLKNESTNEFLVFKWKPTIDGIFPNGIWMRMRQLLNYFEPSEYYFDMNPVFRIKPKFILTPLSPSEIQINLTSITPPVYCENSIIPSLTSTVNQTWTAIESGRTSITIDNLLSNTIYRVCIKCRQFYNDSDGLEECEEIITLTNKIYLIVISVILILVVLGTVALIVGLRIKKQKPTPGIRIIKQTPEPVVRNGYVQEPTSASRSNVSSQFFDESSEPMMDTFESTPDDGQGGYTHIADIHDCVEGSAPKLLPSSHD